MLLVKKERFIMAREINHVIDQLSKIEASSNERISSADIEMKEYALLMEQKTKEFDDALEAELTKKLTQIKADLSAENADELNAWRAETELQLEKIDERFRSRHKQIAQKILETIVRL